jgi:DnaJ-class molecular chaperone
MKEQLTLPKTELKPVTTSHERCTKCYGAGEIDAIACHGFGMTQPMMFPCQKCKGSGKQPIVELFFV